jgi:hypothetical protein
LLNEDSGTIPEVDKEYIRNMLTKAWNLYIFRHGSLTEKKSISKRTCFKEIMSFSGSMA